ncbi:MAG: diguanylate cyclase, partial [Acidithiobacillus sp.]|nr:diguanylate cyclase [Acidithiobacillus sp.]
GEVAVPVPGYPWHLQVQWTAATLQHAFWKVQRTRLPIFLTGLLFIAGMGLWTRRLLRRLLRLRQYQEAAVLAQQDLLRQNDPKAMYQRLVEIVVEQTEAMGAFIAVPEADSEWLRVVAASADTPALQQALEQLTPSQDPDNFPYGNMVPSLAFRAKTPQGPIRPEQSPAMTAIQRQQAPLSRIQSAMAYPVFVCEEPEPAAVLVIGSSSPQHFTPPLQRLLGQLAATLGLALTQWRHHQEIQELLHREQDANAFQTALLNSLTVGVKVMRYPDMVIEQVNETLLELFGATSPHQLVGHQMRELYPDEDTYQKVEAFAESILWDGHGLLRDVAYRRLDGTTMYMDLSGERFTGSDKKPRIVWTHVDVTERHTQLETIRQLSNARETLLANTVAGIDLVRYPERVIIDANQALVTLLGYDSREETIGKATSFLYFDPMEDQRMLETARHILDKGQGSLRDLHVLRKDGQDLYVDVSGQRLEGEDPDHPVIVWTAIDVTERHRLAQELSEQALFDPLTRLPNRRFLETQMERDMARASRNEKLLAVCVLDLDGFKPVNDTYGHEAGDEVLIAVAKRLSDTIRKSDFVSRWGGDEFVLLIEELSNLEDLTIVLEKVEEAIRTPVALASGESVQIGVSMGVAILPLGDKEAPDHFLRMADQALYESKKHKEDRERFWVLYGEPVPQKRTTAQRLLQEGGLEIWYQPILDNRARKVVGVEALARLREENGKLWSPAEFLPQLQNPDLFTLSKKVMDQALADLPLLEAQGWSLWVSVNVDPHSISDACVQWVREVVAQGGIDPSRITLEILEGSDFLEQQNVLEHLLELKNLGVRLALDDIGSAYSSLLRLKDLPIDEIKLDQGFV